MLRRFRRVPGILFAFVLAASVLSCAGAPGADPRKPYVPAGQPPADAAPSDAADAPVQNAPQADAPGAGPIEIDVAEAILFSLENNLAFRVERYAPAIRRTFEAVERAVFDPVFAGRLAAGRARAHRSGSPGSVTTDSLSSQLTLAWAAPTGTSVALEGSYSESDVSTSADPFALARVGVTVTQALLEGRGRGANLASLRQARIDTLRSEYEVRAFAEAVVAAVVNAYWDYALAERQIEIYADSLALAEQQLGETRERILIGTVAETELWAAQAQVAERREALINARSSLATTRLRLLRLMNPPGSGLYEREIVLRDEPAIPDAVLDPVSSHVALAMRMRPELNQARLAIERGELEVIRTRNGLLPVLDAFLTLGKTGYSDSFADAIGDLGGDGHDLTVGVVAAYPFGNRAPRARYSRSVLARGQSIEALANLEQLVEVDVRSALIEVERSREQVAATAATRAFREESLRAETEKFRVGKSTAFLVGQAQRDLVASQIGEIRAIVNFQKALVDLYRLEGSLLERHGIGAPGAVPR